jgi:hypothetical protein
MLCRLSPNSSSTSNQKGECSKTMQKHTKSLHFVHPALEVKIKQHSYTLVLQSLLSSLVLRRF